MKEFDHTFHPNIPEQATVRFCSTGSKGGDAGHGGDASIVFLESGSNLNLQVDLKFTDGKKMSFNNGISELSITTCGDWELEGLAIALMDIGRKLLNRDDIIKDFTAWKFPDDLWRHEDELKVGAEDSIGQF